MRDQLNQRNHIQLTSRPTILTRRYHVTIFGGNLSNVIQRSFIVDPGWLVRSDPIRSDPGFVNGQLLQKPETLIMSQRLTGGVAAGAVMALLGQSRREAQRPIGPIVAPKRQTIIGCRKRKERNKAGWKSCEVAKAMARDRECWSDSVEALCAYWREDL